MEELGIQINDARNASEVISASLKLYHELQKRAKDIETLVSQLRE
jgi:hypothetical protein